MTACDLNLFENRTEGLEVTVSSSFTAVAALSTEDTAMTLAAQSNRCETGVFMPFLMETDRLPRQGSGQHKSKLKRTAFFRRLIVVSLRNPVAPQEWLERCFDAVDCEQTVAPLPVPVGASDSWRFVSATSNETTATFQFAAGALQLQSVWAARPGGGPIENTVTVTNTGAAPATFNSTLKSAALQLVVPEVIDEPGTPLTTMNMFEKRGAGTPMPPLSLFMGPVNKTISTGGPGYHVEDEGQYIPLAYFQGDRVGFYVVCAQGGHCCQPREHPPSRLSITQTGSGRTKRRNVARCWYWKTPMCTATGQ
jgi:hypothetical protein